jgi:hypothetical protein
MFSLKYKECRFIKSRPLPSEIEFENTFYADKKLRRRREVLRETIHCIKEHYKSLYLQAEKNLNLWYRSASGDQKPTRHKCLVEVHSGDWGEITQMLTKEWGQCFAVLNMANAYVPGGAYLEGTVAQEENIFRRTDCHFSISEEYLNNGRYYKPEWIKLLNGEDNLVYLDSTYPRICIRGQEIIKNEGLGYNWLSSENIFPFYEMRAAAMDLRSGDKFNPDECLKRIRAQFKTLKSANIKFVVLGAHGCGAFRNPADRVAELYSKVIHENQEHFNLIAFAIYNAGYGPDNYTPFAEQFGRG